LLDGAEIIASAAAAEEMKRFADPQSPIGKMLANWRDYGEGGAFLHEVMGSRFDMANSPMVLPTRTFERQLDLKVGDKDLHLINVGPAHTAGDVLAFVPKDRTIFTGDILFNQVHPIISEHYKAWIAACDYILGLDVEVVVPGHGPISDKSGARTLKEYLLYFEAESRKRFDAGMDLATAVEDISLGAFRGWVDEERIMNNTATFYRAFGGTTPPPLEIFGMAGRYRRKQLAHVARARTPDDGRDRQVERAP
jgi:glyoxylase-like metal-dependent hydrolase (beta-lactamase superfamily II)